MLSDSAFEEYLKPLEPDQAAAIRSVRELLRETSPNLVEAIDDGKWFGGLLTYTAPSGTFAYALGPRSGGFTTFHMMPYYASEVLQQRHGTALKTLLTGKSCIRFRHFGDVPETALRDILSSGPLALEQAAAAKSARSSRRKGADQRPAS